MNYLKYSIKTRQFGGIQLQQNTTQTNNNCAANNKQEQDNSRQKNSCINRAKDDQEMQKLLDRENHRHNKYVKQGTILKFNKSTQKPINVNIQSIKPDQQVEKQPNKQQAMEIQSLRCILINNANNIDRIANEISNLYKNTIELYNSHQRKLRQVVNNRCLEIEKIINKVILSLKQRQNSITEIDDKVDYMINVIIQTKQNLGIIQKKQNQLQRIQQQHKHKRLIQTNNLLKLNNQQISNPEISFSDTIQIQNTASLETQLEADVTIQNFIRNTKNQTTQNYYSFRQFPKQYQKDKKNHPTKKSQNIIINQYLHGEKKSPFQANQLLISGNPNLQKIKNQQYIIDCQTSQKNFKNSQYCKYIKQYAYETKQTYLNKQQDSNSPNWNKQQTFQNLKKKVESAVQKFPNKQVWIDNLNCLRRKNGAYIFDDQHNVFIFSRQIYLKLASENIIFPSKF